MSCPFWCTQDHAKRDASGSVHVATVARGDGADGRRIDVKVYRYGDQAPQVFLQLYGHVADAASSWTQPLPLQPDDAIAFASVLPTLGGPQWLADALTAAAALLGHHSAASTSSPATDPATPVTS